MSAGAAVVGYSPLTAPLDLAKEIERYGADTLGGVGISVPG